MTMRYDDPYVGQERLKPLRDAANNASAAARAAEKAFEGLQTLYEKTRAEILAELLKPGVVVRGITLGGTSCCRPIEESFEGRPCEVLKNGYVVVQTGARWQENVSLEDIKEIRMDPAWLAAEGLDR